MAQSVRILGIDPGLRRTGWGLITCQGSRVAFLASGAITPPAKLALADRLCALAEALDALVADHAPDEAAVEETFVNADPRSALKLGQARGVCLLAPARHSVPVAEYAANRIKKSVVGAGHADKTQVAAMVARLLPGSRAETADAADALAIALCHAFHRKTAALRAVS
ncbi:crossover junction endodeoxyribonuclease RuvC [Parvularcula lutaonensis]|uniref:Crossover junction endodeoxyribonuclease RuvC n=1 Tax=Parvularcula lutaonensis TaxID=491923 RepID=A0ABV7MAF2_9PROT|nr:crossover junction endodeoxyribonuclease RuvC [Parvularcula lutaonensis]GGY44959.1 crossover junction endodeoxyribonuclease RuvC [Parvularcula lutaonensis]